MSRLAQRKKIEVRSFCFKSFFFVFSFVCLFFGFCLTTWWVSFVLRFSWTSQSPNTKHCFPLGLYSANLLILEYPLPSSVAWQTPLLVKFVWYILFSSSSPLCIVPGTYMHICGNTHLVTVMTWKIMKSLRAGTDIKNGEGELKILGHFLSPGAGRSL